MSTFKRHLLRRICTLFLSVGLLATGTLSADERILVYQSDILIRTSGELIVTETIRVRAEGQDIRRGIFRDFPTSYKDRLGNHYRVDLNILDVKRNGAPEPFHTEKRANGVRIYMGSANQMVGKGTHEYQLRYQTSRQLGFFQNHDELYWNVTGNGWQFPIDHASARIELPAAVSSEDLQISFYTGPQGAQGRDAQSNIVNERTIVFESTRGLQPYEGLTIAVGWPKGIVHQPSSIERIRYFLRDNAAALVLLIGFLASLGSYLLVWNRHGRDPRKGVIIPRFRPPMGLTPAGCSYVHNMSFGKQAFAAAVVSLGVKGYLEIQEQDDDFTLHRKSTRGRDKASSGESAVLESLFENGTEIELDQKNHKDFMKARQKLKTAMKTEHLGRLFKLNTVFALPAVILTIVAVLIAAQLQGSPPVWISFVVLVVALHLTFLFLLRSPTPAGRQIMDEIEGFKMYLDTAEQDRLDLMKSPRLTPEVFETFLPYAYALGVENNWCDRFARELPEELTNRGGYQPAWYTGSRDRLGALSHLGNDFNSSFSSAISSAASPPGSSSGSGGGGSSGGGGGGGGGGGW
ncbi:MAG: DUF2207 domain-containing protein [Xanthomonadales bacterium]|nr:DUF2207 domain-containing protein [Xanthomonadales bacterium]